jgi:hypothetical protein
VLSLYACALTYLLFAQSAAQGRQFLKQYANSALGEPMCWTCSCSVSQCVKLLSCCATRHRAPGAGIRRGVRFVYARQPGLAVLRPPGLLHLLKALADLLNHLIYRTGRVLFDIFILPHSFGWICGQLAAATQLESILGTQHRI